MKGAARLAAVRSAFPDETVSAASLRRIETAVEGADPINFAPALLPGWKPGGQRSAISDDAWRLFLTLIRNAGPDWPLKSAWRDVRDLAAKEGWDWPSYSSVNRRWSALPEAEKLHARLGGAETRKRLAIPAHRDKTTIRPMEWVSLDGRTQDFWVDWGDGRAVRPVTLVLVDCASNLVLDFELCRSENAADTVRLVKRVCRTYGIFDTIYTDNGSAFSGHLVAGGNVQKFRRSKDTGGFRPPDACFFLGIEIKFAQPGNARAKIAERTYATLSCAVDDRPEFRGAHAGHAPGASPSASVRPVPVETALAVLRREVARHNSERGRRGQGMCGRSYREVFEVGIADRPRRVATEKQLRLASLLYREVAVDRYGQITVDTWVYGSDDTQAALLPHHGKGRILFGRDPDDFDVPGIAFDAKGHLICNGIQPVARGAYDSQETAREAGRLRKRAADATRQAAEANDYLSTAELDAALANLSGLETSPAPSAPAVVKGQFRTPLSARKAVPKSERGVPEEFIRIMDAKLAAGRGRGGETA